MYVIKLYFRAIGSAAYGGHTLRTPQYNSKWLNEPQFVGSFDDDKFVYFVFREPAIEYMNCGKVYRFFYILCIC